MGCCQSRDRSSDETGNSPAVPPAPVDSSRAPTNQQQQQQPTRSQSTVVPAPPTRPNQPIRPPTPLASSPAHVSNQPPPWTQRQLAREREAFFDTRVSGSHEIWKALRLVCEEVRAGELVEAQGILDALNITCPSGRIASGRGGGRGKGGLYDERGELYDVPAWVVTDPEDVVFEGDGEKEDVEEAQLSTKGKGRAEDPGEMVQLRARLSHRGTDVVVSVGLKQRVGDVSRLVREEAGESSSRVRLMYLGKTLDERASLEESGWTQGHVVNAMVFEGG